MDFKTAKQTFSRARDKHVGYRLPGRNGATRLVRAGEGFGILLYNTIVVKIEHDGSYTLNSGGYQTSTTKDRIEAYAPVSAFSSEGQWFVTPKGKSVWGCRSKERFIYRFESGMRIDGNGKIIAKAGSKVQALTVDEFQAWSREERNRKARERREFRKQSLNRSLNQPFQQANGTY